MSNARRALAMAVNAEAHAYAFTLAIWSTGAVLIAEHGTPDVGDVFSFVAGAVAAMAITAAVAAGSLGAPLHQEESERRAYGTVHLFSSFGAVASGWGVAAAVGGALGFFLAALAAVLALQLLLAAEIALSTSGSGRGQGDAFRSDQSHLDANCSAIRPLGVQRRGPPVKRP
jgi:hypothetical protein